MLNHLSNTNFVSFLTQTLKQPGNHLNYGLFLYDSDF